MMLRTAMQSIHRAPVRAGLTALGVVIGVAAIITTISIGEGARVRLEESLSRPESRVVYLAAVVPRAQWSNANEKLPQTDQLRVEDYYALRQDLSGISALSPAIYVGSIRIHAEGHSVDSVLEGVDVQGFAMGSYGIPVRDLKDGALFSATDVTRAANVCVITVSLAERLFEDERPIGRSLLIRETPFTVVGVVADEMSSSALMPNARDLHVFIPFTSLLRRIDKHAEIGIRAQAANVTHVASVKAALSDVMERRRAGRHAEFRVIDVAASIQAFAEGTRTVSRLLALVGAVSLLVGGVGIMNIMLVSVRERRREIGVRMAVGTRTSDVLRQFLTESIALSALGGAAGIIVGVSIASLVTLLNEWPTKVTLPAVFLAFGCSVMAGICFGYHPARRATRLSPVEALRTD